LRIASLLLLGVFTSFVGCSSPVPESAPESVVESAPEEPAPVSKGFQPQKPRPVRPLSADEQLKMQRVIEQSEGHSDSELDALIGSRRIPRKAGPELVMDLYLDAQLQRTWTTEDLATPQDLASLLGEPGAKARSVLVGAESGHLWILPEQLSSYLLRLNKRKLAKLEPLLKDKVSGDGAGKGMGAGGGVKRRGREQELRDVYWIELRSAGGDPLPGEPGGD